jgi:PadR family transcriptional regulator, regulatory protein PadR
VDQGMAGAAGKVSRFELAPPRRFALPAVLLLLSERPGYGYELVARLADFRFGHVDRPAVYRALAQLEADGLAEASAQSGSLGQARRVYRVTPLGERALRAWMGVIKEEHDYLGQVLRRYQATGTADAVMAEVEGGWASALSSGWSPVSPALVGHRRLVPVDAGPAESTGPSPTGPVPGEPGPADAGPVGVGPGPHLDGPDLDRGDLGAKRDFQLLPDRSVLLIEVRSTVGPLSFGALGVTGSVHAAIVDGTLRTDLAVSGRLEIDVSRLSSGNSLYDAELRRRIDARRFPTVTVELRSCAPSGPGARYRVEGELTFHGMTRPAQGTVNVEVVPESRLIITGEQIFDIRDFAIGSPTMLMLRIYPDVRVRLHAEAALEEAR